MRYVRTRRRAGDGGDDDDDDGDGGGSGGSGGGGGDGSSDDNGGDDDDDDGGDDDDDDGDNADDADVPGGRPSPLLTATAGSRSGFGGGGRAPVMGGSAPLGPAWAKCWQPAPELGAFPTSDPELVAFASREPAAGSEAHVLIAPRRLVRDAAALEAADAPLLEEMLAAATRIVRGAIGDGFDEKELLTGFHWPPRVTVKWLHLHVLYPRVRAASPPPPAMSPRSTPSRVTRAYVSVGSHACRRSGPTSSSGCTATTTRPSSGMARCCSPSCAHRRSRSTHAAPHSPRRARPRLRLRPLHRLVTTRASASRCQRRRRGGQGGQRRRRLPRWRRSCRQEARRARRRGTKSKGCAWRRHATRWRAARRTAKVSGRTSRRLTSV